MDKVKVLYVNQNGDALFKETINYCRIPPIGRHVIWMKGHYEVSHIVEDWDEKTDTTNDEPKIVVTLVPLMFIKY